MQYGIGALLCAALTPDETQLVTGGADGNVRFWSAGSGQLLRTLVCHEQGICTLVFSSDGKRLLTGCLDGTGRLWEAATGRLLATVQKDHYPIGAAALAPDGKTLYTSDGSSADAWDAASGKLLRSIVLNPGGAKPASGGAGRTSKIFPHDAPDSLQYLAYLWPCYAFSPDGKRLITRDVNDGSKAVLWDTDTNQRLRTLAGGGFILTMSFSADGKQAVTSHGTGTAGTVCMWDVNTGQLIRTLSSPYDAWDLAVSPDGKRVAAASWDLIYLWDAASGWQCRQWQGHENFVYSVAFSADSKRLLTCGEDQAVRVWDAASGRALHQCTGHTGHIIYHAAVALSRDGKRVLTGHADKTARLWDAQSGQLLRTLTGYAAYVRFAAFSADGKALLTSDWKEARVSDAASGQTLRSNTFTSSGLDIFTMAISPDGQKVLAGCWNGGAAAVLDLATGKVLQKLATGLDWVHLTDWTADGKWLLVGGYKNPTPPSTAEIHSLQVFDARTGLNTGQYICGLTYDWVNAADISADGNKVMIGGYLTNNVYLYQSRRSSPYFTWTSPGDSVQSVAFSPDGRRTLIGMFGDMDTLIWNPASGRIHGRLPHPGSSTAAIFSADGQRALTGCWDGSARLWDVTCGARGWRRYE